MTMITFNIVISVTGVADISCLFVSLLNNCFYLNQITNCKLSDITSIDGYKVLLNAGFFFNNLQNRSDKIQSIIQQLR